MMCDVWVGEMYLRASAFCVRHNIDIVIARERLTLYVLSIPCGTLRVRSATNERPQITVQLYTPMHVIMNVGQLFVLIPSSGNIGHFEFSIFNALVSPPRPPAAPDGTLPHPITDIYTYVYTVILTFVPLFV